MSSITRGAVLYKLGLNLVKEHVMRVHYGIATWVPFEARHPKSLQIFCLDGTTMCKDVMWWYARKVYPKTISSNGSRTGCLMTDV